MMYMTKIPIFYRLMHSLAPDDGRKRIEHRHTRNHKRHKHNYEALRTDNARNRNDTHREAKQQ